MAGGRRGLNYDLNSWSYLVPTTPTPGLREPGTMLPAKKDRKTERQTDRKKTTRCITITTLTSHRQPFT